MCYLSSNKLKVNSMVYHHILFTLVLAVITLSYNSSPAQVTPVNKYLFTPCYENDLVNHHWKATGDSILFELVFTDDARILWVDEWGNVADWSYYEKNGDQIYVYTKVRDEKSGVMWRKMYRLRVDKNQLILQEGMSQTVFNKVLKEGDDV